MTDNICVEEFVFTLQQRGPISHRAQARQAGNLRYFTTVRSRQPVLLQKNATAAPCDASRTPAVGVTRGVKHNVSIMSLARHF